MAMVRDLFGCISAKLVDAWATSNDIHGTTRNVRISWLRYLKPWSEGGESVNKPFTYRGERQSGGRELVELSARTLRDGWLHGLRALASWNDSDWSRSKRATTHSPS